MDSTPIAFENMHQIEALRQRLGDAECRRLGFIATDERGVDVITVAGFGFLIFQAYERSQTAAEIFAAGYQCAAEFYDPDSGTESH